MFWPSRLKILFCIQVFFGLWNVIVSNKDFLKSMSVEDRKSIFGTEDGSIPECEVVEWVRPSRSKRSGNEFVNIPINAFGLLNTTLCVVEDDDLISRSRTGVWAARYNPLAHQNVSYYPRPHIFNDIGDFEFLQNIEEGSAVTRFWDSDGNEKIVGIIKHNYTIKSVPKEFEHAFNEINPNPVLKKRSVNSMNDQDKKRSFLKICKDAGILQEYFRRDTYAKIDVRSDPNLHRPKRQITNLTYVPDIVYPKLLVIPDFSTVHRYTHVRDFMLQLIVQLNCIDMMFRQLKQPEVHLNIAGIIIPLGDEATPYMLNYINAGNRIIGNDAVFEAKRNFQNEQRRFPRHQWESILLLTTHPILFRPDNDGQFIEVNGLSSTPQGCSGAVGIARFTESMEGIFTLTHELGHMLGADHDNVKEQCKNISSYLMATSYDYSVKLEWSNCSRAAFRTHFRSYAESCRHSRRWTIPNAVKSMPGAWLRIGGQCDNLFNDSTGSCVIDNSPDCFVYGCRRNGTCNWVSVPPMEGTLLFNEYGLRACVNDTMVSP